MRRVYAILVALCCAVAAALATAGPAQAASQTITNGTQFTDTSGNVVHAHGGGVIKVGSYYYWFGEDRNADNTFKYVDAYRSTDLKNWEFRNHVLTQSSASELGTAYIERPKVIYNASTGKFVMWMHKENGVDYSQARAAVAVSDTVDGNYTYQGSFQPLGQYMSRDITTFVDSDGTGYMVSAARENYDLQIYKLTADYTGIDSLVANPWVGGHREAPALFKRGGVYFMLTSAATGWNANQQQYATATSLAGPWTAMTNVGDSTTYNSQTAYVLPVQGTSGTSYLYMGDRWGNSFGGTVNDSRYVWLPLTFPTSTSMSMSWYPEVSVDTTAGDDHRDERHLQHPRRPVQRQVRGRSQPVAVAGRRDQPVHLQQRHQPEVVVQGPGHRLLRTHGPGQLPVPPGELRQCHPGELHRRHRPAVEPDHVRQLCARQGPGERRVPGRVRRVHRQLRRHHHVHLQRRDQPAVDARNMTSGQ